MELEEIGNIIGGSLLQKILKIFNIKLKTLILFGLFSPDAN